ncbi:trp operon leader peptide [Enterobacter cloacae complex sp. 2022EL-00788]
MTAQFNLHGWWRTS